MIKQITTPLGQVLLVDDSTNKTGKYCYCPEIGIIFLCKTDFSMCDYVVSDDDKIYHTNHDPFIVYEIIAQQFISDKTDYIDGIPLFEVVEEEIVVRGKTLEYWKQNAEEDYLEAPISVLNYIGILEKLINKQPYREVEIVVEDWNKGFTPDISFQKPKTTKKIIDGKVFDCLIVKYK